MVASVLDDVPGLGDSRRRALLRQFGSLKRLRAASAQEIASVPGVGPRTAQAVVAALREQASEPALNVTTGEVLEDAGGRP
jgi:excinuclease ABC subunit C